MEVAPDRVRGLFEPYDGNLISHQPRLAYGVPGVDQQKNNLAEFNAGNYPARILPQDVADSHAA